MDAVFLGGFYMYDDIPNFLREFLLYMQNIKNRSQSTIREYHYDLRDTFRFLKLYKMDKINLILEKISTTYYEELLKFSNWLAGING